MLITSLNRYEQQMSSCPAVPKEFCSVLAGVSRVTRLSKSYGNNHSQVIWDTGANVIGPAFFFFTWWVLETAKKLNIQRLYFFRRVVIMSLIL